MTSFGYCGLAGTGMQVILFTRQATTVQDNIILRTQHIKASHLKYSEESVSTMAKNITTET